MTVEVSVSDPDGTSDLTSGTLRDPQTGSSYTRFKPEVGSYTATVSWAYINAVRRISGNSRRFRIVFRDSANQTAERDVDVDVGCERSGYGLCSGECKDFQSISHCGRCNDECPDNENCVGGQCRCSGSDDWADWGCSSTPPESDVENPAGQPLEEYTCVCVES